MATLNEYIIKLTDHRDRDLLELTLAKALIHLLPLQRVVVAKVVSAEGTDRWLDVASLDARGGGKVVDPLQVDFTVLPLVADSKDRLRCMQSNDLLVIAWAGETGPRITYVPLLERTGHSDSAVLEIHSALPLDADELGMVSQLRHVYRNMYRLLAYSDRDALTGLLNRKALDDTFYSALLEEMDAVQGEASPETESTTPAVPGLPAQERRHRVPPNYWLGMVTLDGFAAFSEKSGYLVAEEVLLLAARIFNNTFRTYDRIYRLDGEQFAVLMHCPQEAPALAAFERLRTNIAKFNFPVIGQVTATGGFTRVTPDDSPQTALQRAEQVIQHGRQKGGNTMSSYGALATAPVA